MAPASPRTKVCPASAAACRWPRLPSMAMRSPPGRYVGAEAVRDDGEAFLDKMQKLTEKRADQMAKGAAQAALIRQKLSGLGYEL